VPWDELRDALAADAGADDQDGLDARLDDLAADALRDAAAFREHPVDVNAAGVRELLRVPFLEPGAALRIVAARASSGPFATTGDLVAHGCLSAEAFAAVAPYVVVKAPVGSEPLGSGDPAPAMPEGFAWSALSRGAFAWGTAEASGAPGTFARFRLSRGDGLRVGVACERDQGERSLTDHVAFGVEWHALGAGSPVDVRLVLGDLSVGWAQGLVAGSSGIVSTDGYPGRSDRVRPYDGSAEVVARRGVHARVSRGPVVAQVVLARTRLDASLDDSGLVTALRPSGSHRTDSELEGRDALTEEMTCIRVTVEPRAGWRIGATAARFAYAPAFAPGDPERQRFRFSGSGLRLSGADVLFAGERWHAAGEAAVTDEGAVAWLGAAKVTAGRATAALGAAHLARDYWSPLGAGAPGASGGTNGTGAWLRVRYRPGDGVDAWCELAVSRRPWRSYLNELPDGRRRFSLGVERSLGSLGRASVRARETVADTETGDPRRTAMVTTRLARADWRSTADPGLAVTVIRATSAADSAGTEAVLGSLLALGVRFETTLGAARLGTGCFAVSSRGEPPAVAVYEPRLPGEFGLLTLRESGTRWYARIRACLPFGAGVTARVAGGPGHGRVDAGIGIEFGG